ncbi:hypothetical protein QZH41_008117 [Actinostola sp. cb2023]|nr:hypothetical protein QZH41_008117 [Actinostola sp. cb2023]
MHNTAITNPISKKKPQKFDNLLSLCEVSSHPLGSSPYLSEHRHKMYAISKLNKQHEQTWINLQKRLNEVQFPYDRLFEQNVYDFIKNKAVSVGSSEGYFVPSLLTTTAFALACNGVQVDSTSHKQPINIYTIFVGFPGTGKSSAIQYCAQDPLENNEMGDSIISKTTSSGLVKLLATGQQPKRIHIVTRGV